ncbi:Cytochrome c oxidase assembly protein CtaG [Bosea sp. 62]|uniref:cytochrome c oxidase assembly protein n=1 Tax=unclassified Bosea (in: a-proteobacteria) TaxID=2653178 RepID=UPI00125373D2|nr:MULTISPECIES: cytochrome c oxidase assembly protein [unclassified Bosea (in: a-proteobacteria)]CAD5293861.1 Cytochrome c oxidase assembly protein CtaG [Bosea sp. 7B]CAD5298209.1 Cytochrome c oxidase assembly protein CtaG [Bosea sp. 21B]CAD5298384.1 Cytochrome c oxidase assembly protein CtaG [Bosea sp. 46]VVT61425.1 Cytochrome c oxidase assembly protein CtaG [Bosea sp. EC-HK365B]VXB15344.1 Cytochrome c oxidase assembly protein CtaG [Bosea sp. 127]
MTAASRNRRTVLACSAAVLAMTGLSFAAVPLYNLFCKVTGFAGTPMVGTAATGKTSERIVSVAFDANVAPALGWRFEAEKTEIRAQVGVTQTVFYKITNTSSRPMTGIATYNVQPNQSGAYFVKIQCFCFTETTLQPGETLEAPVVFYIDPEIELNRELASLKSITLSYTYFPSKNGQPVAESKGDGNQSKL